MKPFNRTIHISLLLIAVIQSLHHFYIAAVTVSVSTKTSMPPSPSPPSSPLSPIKFSHHPSSSSASLLPTSYSHQKIVSPSIDLDDEVNSHHNEKCNTTVLIILQGKINLVKVRREFEEFQIFFDNSFQNMKIEFKVGNGELTFFLFEKLSISFIL